MIDETHYGQKPVYIGDGVEASCDGFYIWLRTNSYADDTLDNQIALEPDVFKSLLDFAKRIEDSTGNEGFFLGDYNKK